MIRTSVHEFIVRTRVQAASDALLETDQSVAEIAQDCGFYDQKSSENGKPSGPELY